MQIDAEQRGAYNAALLDATNQN